MQMKKIISLFLINMTLSFNAVAQSDSAFSASDAEGGPHNNASLVAQLEELKEQLKKIRGDVEQVQFENARINEKFVKFTADIELRLSDINKKPVTNSTNIDQLDNISKNLDDDYITSGALSNSKIVAASPQNDSKKEVVTDGIVKQDAANLVGSNVIDSKTTKESKKKAVQQQYQDAYSLLKAKDYKTARTDFEKFIKDNPDNELVGSAYYWLGETFFLRGEFDNAAVNYLKGYQSNIHGTRSPDNLLKLSKSLAKIEKRKEACTTLLKLKKEFPSASTGIKKQMDEDIKTLRCNP